ncbi:DUF1206 domain-containing protein [Qipengyuania aquimaris]|uniref:DUF1206 domain-containing protein n=1 Tax=Qipengyuania aquimaris TaxID=255984 RepID=UPI001C95F8A4|nr:DUF1206 domain-containing protein [Qipengyuania aquimaris]MBY6128652.1 DUF1206 domain-containing protein [Qipengyuania aquimaris]
MIDKSEKFNWLVRVGYLSRAILYFVLGLVALTSANQIAEGTNGIFEAIKAYPAGTAILWVMVVGLFAYALFRFCSPLFDIENNGSDAKGWGKRLGHAGSGVGHLALAYSAYQFANNSGGSSGGGAKEAASGVLSMDFGGLLLGLLGIALFIAAAFQAKKGITGEFMHRISGRAPSSVRWLGLAGYLARAVVYTVIGWSLFKAGFMSSGASEVKTLGDAVASLAGEGFIFTLTAVGLLLFGIYSVIQAHYRIIPELDSDAGVPQFRA